MNPRKQYLATVGSVVVKLGTQLLCNGQGRLDPRMIAQVAGQVVALRNREGGAVRVTLVSSGAIGAGMPELGLTRRPADLAKLQAVAAVGQRKLMDAWADAFDPHGIPVAQILLTREDIDDRTRFLNARNTITAAHELGAIPIVNENDTISTDEIVKITFGDNDLLAALVAQALRADLLILLSVVDGLLDIDGQPVRLVEAPGQGRDLVRAEKTPLGKGGMLSKLEAARMVTDAGEAMVIADGRMPQLLLRLLEGEELGTFFLPSPRKRSSRSRWISSVRPAGAIIVDEGAAVAVAEKNRSLLAAGIIAVQGRFERGDVVAIQTPDGRAIARGLCNYPSAELERIRGKKTSEVKTILAQGAYEEVIHRDNLVVG